MTELKIRLYQAVFNSNYLYQCGVINSSEKDFCASPYDFIVRACLDLG
jgi:hypothetical protein